MDLKTFFYSFERGCDWQPAAVGLVEGDELDTAVLLSLFTDRRAEPGDDVEGDPRGWWGDAIPIGDERAVPLGSRLWLLAREKQTASTLRRAEAYGREALQWLIDDGHARALDIAASAPRTGLLRLDVAIDSQPFRFELTP
ncbi:phage GP46 family protein [Chitiniphilus eburneus]|uniref:Phage tail protein n=1 Tax=Chitiniphilus eburneus TaxID=2571148 RepID=A0A4U0QBX7_9NEIS|nr:phage GP46 family protein [Chitiniphilus eburneus]TJZ78796.1 hypothetical protein FAZ21_00455 [Chitiniphilus eburneus]